jgi:hypothetical protein
MVAIAIVLIGVIVGMSILEEIESADWQSKKKSPICVATAKHQTPNTERSKAKIPKPKTKCERQFSTKPKTKDQRSKAKDQRPKAKDQRPKTKDQRPKTTFNFLPTDVFRPRIRH